MSRRIELNDDREVCTVDDASMSRPSRRLPLSPAAEPAPAADVDEHIASLVSPRSFEADQYRVLRHFVEQARAGKELKVLAVTSPAAGDGKTTTAVNLAVTLAQTPGARVLLVDADLRRPFVATKLGLDVDANGVGLAGAVLDERVGLEAVVRTTPYSLAVLPAGTPPDNAYELLESPRVGELLSEARDAYDYVVLDTPPVLLVPDCRLMSQWIDGFLLVVAANRTPRKLLAETLDAIAQAQVLGIVFNGDRRPLSGYYKYYGSYHDRGQGRAHGWWPSWLRSGRGKRRP